MATSFPSLDVSSVFSIAALGEGLLVSIKGNSYVLEKNRGVVAEATYVLAGIWSMTLSSLALLY